MMVLGAVGMQAQQEYHVKVFGQTDGLKVRGSVCIAQMNGFIWVGTSSGLIAFDGKNASLYQVPDKEGLGSYYGRVKSIVQSADGQIWVGTRRGIYMFDIRREQLQPFSVKQLPNLVVLSMQFDLDGRLWAIVGGQAYVINVQERTAMLVGEGQVYPSCLMVARDGTVWMGDGNGVLFRYDVRNQRLRAYQAKPEGVERFGNIVSITEMETGELALTSDNDGVCLFSPETLKSRMLLTHDDEGVHISAHTAITPDGENLWIGTERGVLIYHLNDGTLSAIREKHGEMNSLTDNAVHTLYADNDQGVWVGTFFGGIHRISISPPNFSFFPPESENGNVGVVREVCRDRQGHLWAGTEDGGLYVLDEKANQLREAEVEWGAYPRPFNVQSLLLVGDKLWVSTMGTGLYVIDTMRMQVERRYTRTSENAMGVPLYGISLCKQQGTIFLSSANGVYFYDEQEDCFRFMSEFSDIYAHHLYADKHGNVWVASFNKGLWKIRKQKDGTWKGEKTAFAYQSVSVVMEDSYGHYWVGTELHGMMGYDDKTGKTSLPEGTENLRHKIVTSIVEDQHHRLWIGTFDGLYSYNLDKHVCLHMTTSHGLPTPYMNYSGSYVDANGKVYLGTYKGLVRVDPQNFALAKGELRPYFLSLYMNGRHILPGDATGILKETLYQTKELVLSNDQNTFTINYATPTYRNMGMVWYRYRFNPDEPWVVMEGVQALRVNNLSPGKYELTLQASFNPEVWKGPATVLRISVEPPVWLSMGALLGYVLVIVLVVVSIMSFINRSKERRRRTR